MEEIYVNTESIKSFNQSPSTSPPGPRSSEGRFHGGVVLSLVLNFFLLAGAIVFGVLYLESVQRSAAELSAVRTSLSEERDLLMANLTGKTEELNRTLSKMKTCCPGWRMFGSTCYFLSNKSGSWDKGREDCRHRGADLVVIDSPEEQTFLSRLTTEDTWIGLTDKQKEGTWIWVDGTTLSVRYWQTPQPDNGDGHAHLGEEDCVHFVQGADDLNNWNDLSCERKIRWICEKTL
ncbi:CD209 antigen-like protein E isoform X2 [Toxotes jaculatrix]|uniref:CD209 antigen-like protein E isoform X2 n=1 Tax=Toxotes jaculatrix TaxID=941984 RepID=UPI001B3AB662|nr:CD209 antigen-like protein E isoform X2 [Toxotes jaculatrix]